MGASYVSRTYPDMSEAELAKRIDDDCASDAYEDGRSYSGSWGVKSGYDIEYEGYGSSRKVKTFDSVSAAEDHIQESNEKWGPLTAVRARVIEVKLPDGRIASTGNAYGPGIPYGKAVLALQEKSKTATAAVQAFGPAIMARVKAAKSKTKGCNKCGSSIATNYIQSLACPVCRHDFLLTETDRAKFATLRSKQEKAQAAVVAAHDAELKKLAEKNTKFVWVVGGWCSS